MRGLTITILLFALGGALVIGALAANYSPGNIAWTGNGLTVSDPRIDAQAQAIQQQSQDAATLARLQQERAALDNETETKAQWAAVTGRVAFYLSLGVGAGLLFIGCVVALNTWLVKRAGAIYPNAAGQYPVVTMSGFGWATMFDPNRQLGPVMIHKTPTIIDQLAAVMLAWRSGTVPALPTPAAEFPPTGDQATMLQVASQAQAVGLMAAATRQQWPTLGSAPQTKEERARLIETVTGAQPGARMPTVRVIDDPNETTKLLELFARGD